MHSTKVGHSNGQKFQQDNTSRQREAVANFARQRWVLPHSFGPPTEPIGSCFFATESPPGVYCDMHLRSVCVDRTGRLHTAA
eukprot:scaffold356598_cov14-Prasinocladus_malaysianus.AAC.2